MKTTKKQSIILVMLLFCSILVVLANIQTASATTYSVTFGYLNPYLVHISDMPLTVDGNTGYFAGGPNHAFTYSLSEGYHTVTYPLQCAWWTFNSIWQDGNYATSAQSYTFYVSADTTIAGAYNW